MTYTSASTPSAAHTLSVIVPVFNEQDSLNQLVNEVEAGIRGQVQSWEMILVDDGSTDSSWSIISGLAAENPAVSGIRLRRNFGKAAALTAGMQAARGSLILTMDADLQDDPAEIPAMISGLNGGADFVNGWKKHRLDPWHKVYPSRVFNSLVGMFSGLRLHDHNCGLKLFRSEVAREIRIYGELHRFIPVLAHARGFRVTELAVNHRPRQHGHSKYGVRRFLRGLLDLMTVTFLTGYGRRPLHALGSVGLLFFVTGLAGLVWLAGLWMLMQLKVITPYQPIGGRPLLAYSVASTLLGGQILSLGLLAELLVANSPGAADSFSIRDTTRGNPHAPAGPQAGRGGS